MNKKEFYKELMETYTVDTERIKLNAKRRAAKKKDRSFRKWMISGAAAVTAAAAVVAFFAGTGFNFGGDGLDITDTDAAAARARLVEAEKNYVAMSQTDERLDMYISFNTPLTRSEIQMTLSAVDDDGEIDLLLLYGADGAVTKFADSSADGAETFLGAKIEAPASLCNDIRLLTKVAMVEFARSGITDDDFIPYGGSERIDISDDTYSEPIELSVPETSYNGGAGTAVSETPAGASEPTEETSASETETEVSDTSASTAEEKTPVQVPVPYVNTANFINMDKLVVTTPDSIRLYKMAPGGSAVDLETTFYVSNPKVACASLDGTKMFLTACDENGRTKLYYANGETGTLSELDTSYLTSGGAEIASISCTGGAETVVIKTVSLDKTRIYAADRSDGMFTVFLAGEFECPVSPLTYCGGKVYCALTDASVNEIRVVSLDPMTQEQTEIAVYSGSLKSSRSATFDAALLTVSNTDENGEVSNAFYMLTPDGNITETSADAEFSPNDGRVYRADGAYYRVIDGVPAEITEEEAAPLFEAAPPFSIYACEIDGDGNAFVMLSDE